MGTREEQQAAYDAHKNRRAAGGREALAPQQNPNPTTSGSGEPGIVSTPAAAPALDTTGAGGAGPDSPPPQKGNRNLLEDGGSPADMDLDIEGLEKSVANVANGSTPTTGALEGNGEAADPDVAAAKLADDKVKLGENLKANGVNAETALKTKINEKLARLKQLEKDGAITPEVHTKLRDRWKNIFNVIPKEDFGMVLMDFGMRAMMAGESMGSMAALGAAGSGALAGVAQRKDQDYQRGVDQLKMAGDEARADTNTETAADAESKRGADKIDTDGGIMQWNPKTGSYDIPVLKADGTPAMPSSLSGRPPTDKWKIDRLIARGMDPAKAERIILLKEDPFAAKQQALAAWNRFEGDPDATITIGGKTYSKRDIKRGEIPGLKEKFIDETLAILGIPANDRGALSSSGGGEGGAALGGGTGMMTRAEMAKALGKEPTNEQWDEYAAEYN